MESKGEENLQVILSISSSILIELLVLLLLFKLEFILSFKKSTILSKSRSYSNISTPKIKPVLNFLIGLVIILLNSSNIVVELIKLL